MKRILLPSLLVASLSLLPLVAGAEDDITGDPVVEATSGACEIDAKNVREASIAEAKKIFQAAMVLARTNRKSAFEKVRLLQDPKERKVAIQLANTAFNYERSAANNAHRDMRLKAQQIYMKTVETQC